MEKEIGRQGEGQASGGAEEKENTNMVTGFHEMHSSTGGHRSATLKRICSIDFAQLKQLGFLGPNDQRSRQAEEYRTIKRPLLYNAFGKGAALGEQGNLIQVTSAMPGEGKTFTSINLAISMAMEQDFTVLLVDTDDVRCSCSRLLGVEDSVGLVDVLQDPKLELSDAIVPTNLPRLRLLPAGRSSGNVPELLGSERMQHLVQEMSRRYADRIVIFDSPPLLATSQSTILAQFMGQVLVVVEAGKTPLQAVLDSVAQLNRDKPIGMVLNKSPQVFKSDYYGGYYGHYQ